ncbi:MAG: CtpF protein [Pseudomonadota bacterium]
MNNLAFDHTGLDDEGLSSAPTSDAVRPLPRITMQAFCETPEVREVLESAFSDRRMDRVHKSLQMGGIDGAVDFYAGAPTPNLIIVEMVGRSDAIKGSLERLAEVCDAGSRVIVIGHVNDVLLYRDLMRNGVSEYLVAPFDPLALMVTVSDIFTSPEAEPLGKLVAFVGARGGVGSSTVAHNVAWSITTELDTDAVIADMDLPFGTAGLDFNQDPIQGLANAVFESERVDEQMMERLLFKCTDKLGLFAAPSTLEREYDLGPEAYDSIMDIMRRTVPCGVLDIPHVWTGWARNAICSADEIVITAAPDLASLRNAKNLVELINSRRKLDTPPRIILNQVGVPKRPEISEEDFATALDIAPMGSIAYDPQLFGVAANNGQMIAEMTPNAKPVEAFHEIAKAVTGRTVDKRQKSSPLRDILAKLSKSKK